MDWHKLKGAVYEKMGIAEFGVVPRAYQSSTEFPCLKPIEQNWQAIRDEALALRPDDFHNYRDTAISRATWRNYPLVYQGIRYTKNCDRCPVTARLVTAVPGLRLAVFAVLPPATSLKPHRGNPCGTWRAHMGLVVPENAWFESMGEKKVWDLGRFFVFHETCLHAAHNHSDRDRIVLILDFLEDPTNWKLYQRAVSFAEYAKHYAEMTPEFADDLKRSLVNRITRRSRAPDPQKPSRTNVPMS